MKGAPGPVLTIGQTVGLLRPHSGAEGRVRRVSSDARQGSGRGRIAAARPLDQNWARGRSLDQAGPLFAQATFATSRRWCRIAGRKAASDTAGYVWNQSSCARLLVGVCGVIVCVKHSAIRTGAKQSISAQLITECDHRGSSDESLVGEAPSNTRRASQRGGDRVISFGVVVGRVRAGRWSPTRHPAAA